MNGAAHGEPRPAPPRRAGGSGARIATVVGARPQFIKMAPVSLALKAAGLTEISIHTGQHYDHALSTVFFEELGIRPPDHRLEAGSGSHGAQTARILERIEPVLMEARPDWVVVIGDTNSTLAAALAAAKLGLPLAHVEAGLRSGNRAMPEETNRIVADHLADRLYHATRAAERHLEREGLLDRARRVGDVTLDAVRLFASLGETAGPDAAGLAGIAGGGPYVVATIHRAETTDDPARLRRVWDCLNASPWPVIFPIHPRTREAAERAGLAAGSRLRLIPPIGYPATLRLVRAAALLLTDSGGLQKEAYCLGTPCVTLRGETEWVETVAAGWNRLCDPARPIDLDFEAESRRRGAGIEEYGDGHAAGRIADDLARG